MNNYFRSTFFSSGFPALIGAHLIWGFIPLYLALIRIVPPLEFLGWRVIWTVPFCVGIMLLRGNLHDFFALFSDKATFLTLLCTAFLIGSNWLGYVWAVQTGHIFAASLGYYINPLINILLATVFLHERLNIRQWAAVGTAAIGVGILALDALDTLAVSVMLGLSFSLYGLLRKKVAVGPLVGLSAEAMILLVPASLITGYYASTAQGTSFGGTSMITLLLIASGAITAMPLLLFTVAARKMSFASLGFMQFFSPSIVFILGVTVFNAPLKTSQLYSFMLIWVAVAIFITDLVLKNREAKRALPSV